MDDCKDKTIEYSRGYVNGTIDAYDDCAAFLEKVKSKLPPELSFFASSIETLYGGLVEKANNARLLAHDSNEC